MWNKFSVLSPAPFTNNIRTNCLNGSHVSDMSSFCSVDAFMASHESLDLGSISSPGSH